MRFAITGCDRSLGIFEEFLHAGWEPIKLFSTPATNALDANSKITKLAERHGMDVQLTRMTEDNLQELRDRNCNALIVASYNWRIGNWRPYMNYAVNFHPSPLPIGRGPYPLVRAILEHRQSWAMTCHKLEPEFDCGDIIASEDFALSEQECHESLSLKLQMSSVRLARKVANNFQSLWDLATPQGDGEYWPIFTAAEQSIDFSKPVQTILHQLRAFGSLECYANVNDEPVYIRRGIGWEEAHNNRPGMAVHIDNQTIVVAARDGYIALLEWGLIPPPELD